MVVVLFTSQEGISMAEQVETFLGKCPLKRNGILSIPRKKKSAEDEEEAKRWKEKTILYEQMMTFKRRMARVEKAVVEIQNDLFQMAEMFGNLIPPDAIADKPDEK